MIWNHTSFNGGVDLIYSNLTIVCYIAQFQGALFPCYWIVILYTTQPTASVTNKVSPARSVTMPQG